MKVIFLTLMASLGFACVGYSQISKAKHYQMLLQETIDSLIIKETNRIGPRLKLKTYQISKLQSYVILYYISLRQISDKYKDRLINRARRNLEWNFTEYIFKSYRGFFIAETRVYI